MRALIVSDEVNSLLYSPLITKVAGNIDVIISCGDLPVYYLDYLVTMLGKPLFYVCGNHDHYERKKHFENSVLESNKFSESHFNYNKKNNFGGKNLDKRVEKINGMLIGGLEGSLLYNHGEHQYTEKQMRKRISRLAPTLFLNRAFHGRFLDILVTHAPPRHIHDKEDIPHRGFEAFLDFIRFYRPKYLLHGHIHIYDRKENRIDEYFGTKVINCYNYQILDLQID